MYRKEVLPKHKARDGAVTRSKQTTETRVRFAFSAFCVSVHVRFSVFLFFSFGPQKQRKRAEGARGQPGHRARQRRVVRVFCN